MDTNVTTNWLTIVGLLYFGVGLVFLVKPLAMRLPDATRASIAARAAAQRAGALFAQPFLAAGFVALVAGQSWSMPLDAPVVLLLILLCFALLLYVGLDGYLIEDSEADAEPRELARRVQPAAHVEQDRLEPDRPTLQIVQST
jgi:hypothetical protein